MNGWCDKTNSRQIIMTSLNKWISPNVGGKFSTYFLTKVTDEFQRPQWCVTWWKRMLRGLTVWSWEFRICHTVFVMGSVTQSCDHTIIFIIECDVLSVKQLFVVRHSKYNSNNSVKNTSFIWTSEMTASASASQPVRAFRQYSRLWFDYTWNALKRCVSRILSLTSKAKVK